MDKLLPAIGILILVALVFALMAMSWRSRRRRQMDLGELAAPPGDLGEITLRDDLLYVATTRANAPLDRIAVAGLGFRARAVVTVAKVGVVLELAGANPAFIPVEGLVAVGRATWTIDRVVNSDGLVFIRWRLGAAEVDSYLRSTDPDGLTEALDELVPIRREK